MPFSGSTNPSAVNLIPQQIQMLKQINVACQELDNDDNLDLSSAIISIFGSACPKCHGNALKWIQNQRPLGNEHIPIPPDPPPIIHQVHMSSIKYNGSYQDIHSTIALHDLN